MTPSDVRRRVARLRGMTGDNEAFHSEEDKLYLDVLTAIAQGEMAQNQDARDMARAAIRTRAIKGVDRWCA